MEKQLLILTYCEEKAKLLILVLLAHIEHFERSHSYAFDSIYSDLVRDLSC